MDNQRTKKKEQREELINVVPLKFGMMDRPIDVQITIHVHNLVRHYGSSHVIPIFKDHLYNPEKMEMIGSGIIVKQIISYYGLTKVRNWFTLIYGWEF